MTENNITTEIPHRSIFYKMVNEHSNDDLPMNDQRGRKTFPMLLHIMLSKAETDGFAHIASWQPHGRCFRIHKHKDFMTKVMPEFFRQSKWSSFQRQLNLYGFNRITANCLDKGAYYHESFLRGKSQLSKNVARQRVKGTKRRVASDPESNPNFYEMSPMPGLSEAPSTTEAQDHSKTCQNDRSRVAPPSPKPQGDYRCENFEEQKWSKNGNNYHYTQGDHIDWPSHDSGSMLRSNTLKKIKSRHPQTTVIDAFYQSMSKDRAKGEQQQSPFRRKSAYSVEVDSILTQSFFKSYDDPLSQIDEPFDLLGLDAFGL